MRGDVYRLAALRATRGHEQRGTRYAVVVQSDLLPLSTWLVAPTSTSAGPADFRPEIDLGGTTTRVLTDQATAVDPQRLGEFAGRLSAGELADVSAALVTVFGLDD
ncbi:MAG: type II toxin-antitoxin system PemK/MazF family toxin [Thermocrispum sp.]